MNYALTNSLGFLLLLFALIKFFASKYRETRHTMALQFSISWKKMYFCIKFIFD